MAHKPSGRAVNLNLKNLSHKPNSAFINQDVISSRSAVPQSPPSSNSSNSRSQRTSNVRSSIQMEPSLQALLIAEGQAAEMISNARAKRNELMRQANKESQAEIEAFRQEHELQYQTKLHKATQLEQFQTKLNTQTRHLLEQMENNVKNERRSVINYIIHCVIDDIPIRAHRNTKPDNF